MNNRILALLIILYYSSSYPAQNQEPGVCKAWLYRDILTITNGLVFEHFRWIERNLIRLAYGKQSLLKSSCQAILRQLQIFQLQKK